MREDARVKTLKSGIMNGMGKDTYGMHDAKSKLSELVQRVQNGETIFISKHGQQVAKLTGLSYQEQVYYPQAFVDMLTDIANDPKGYQENELIKRENQWDTF